MAKKRWGQEVIDHPLPTLNSKIFYIFSVSNLVGFFVGKHPGPSPCPSYQIWRRTRCGKSAVFVKCFAVKDGVSGSVVREGWTRYPFWAALFCGTKRFSRQPDGGGWGIAGSRRHAQNQNPRMSLAMLK